MPAHAAPADDRARAAAATVAAERAQRVHDERRRSTERLFLVGSVAWPAFFLHDVASAFMSGHAESLPWMASLRGGGEAVALLCYLVVRWDRASARAMVAMDYLLFVLGGALLALMAVPIGGLESRYTQGVIIFVFARCTVLPLPWRRAFPVPLACAAAYPATLAAASFVFPELHAQWHDRHALGVLFDNQLFVFASVAVAVFGSHMIDRAQREVRQARKLGNYRLKARIGRGGAGDVWLARQLALDRDVALKVLRDQPWRSEEAVRRFQREALAASKLEHPNTIRIYDFGASDDGVSFIAMELLQGMDLDVLVEAHGALPAARVIYLGRQICGSLAEAHAHGILHRDVKPANVFVTQIGDDCDVVKVLDFGVARLADPRGSLTETGTLFGTPDFMAPEICSGERADKRSDVYSLGAALYFLVTGTTLFPKRAIGEVLMMQISKAPDPPSTRAAAGRVPQDLEAVVMKCLEKDPARRYQSVVEVDRALAACRDAHGWSKDSAREWWDAITTSPRRKAG